MANIYTSFDSDFLRVGDTFEGASLRKAYQCYGELIDFRSPMLLRSVNERRSADIEVYDVHNRVSRYYNRVTMGV